MATASEKPKSAEDLLLDEGLAESRNDRENNAIAKFQEVLARTGIPAETTARAHQLLGCSYYKLGNYHAAIPAFDNAIRQAPQEIFVYIKKGRALQKTRQFRLAEQAFSDAIDRALMLTEIRQGEGKCSSPAIYLDARLQIGIIASKRGNDEDAIYHFDQAIDFVKKYKADTPVSDREKSDCARSTELWYAIKISRFMSLNRLGRVSSRNEIEKIIETVSALPESPGRNRNRIRAYLALGSIYEKDDPGNAAALMVVNTAIRLVNESDEKTQKKYALQAYLNKGSLLRKQDKPEEAIQCFTEGITRLNDLMPDGIASDLLYERGLTNIDMHNFDPGIADLKLLKQTDFRYAMVDIALVEAYRRKAIQNMELEFQQHLLKNFTTTVQKTESNLRKLSDEMRCSLQNVGQLFYLLFFVGMAVFLGAIVWTLVSRTAGSATDPMVLAIGLVGGIDVILSMMLFSPAKIQKNRIDYSQWLMGYYNWLNTQFIAGIIMSEKLMRVHSPANKDGETIDWESAAPMYTFMHTMTREMLETIDKCCEFSDVPYSLGKKKESTAAADTTGEEAAAAEPEEKTGTAEKGSSGKEAEKKETPATVAAATEP